jgi:uncharacterized protein YbjT (DUF2867 family)
MKIVIIGGTGRIGSKLVGRLTERGHDAVPAAPNTGVDTVTGEGLAEVLTGADVVVDVANAPNWEEQAVLDFFTTTTRNVLEAEHAAGIGHHVALSVVGLDGLRDIGYMRAKIAQEELIVAGPIPYSIVRATQFMEFVEQIAEGGADGDVVRLSPALLQPVAADDVAATLADVATGPPLGGRIELAGPEALGIDAWGRRLFAATGDGRQVITDPDARYYGKRLDERSLVPDGDRPRIGAIGFDQWFASHAVAS